MQGPKNIKEIEEYRKWLRDFLKVVRGERSHEQTKRRLGAKSYLYSHWESGRSEPSWEQWVHASRKLLPKTTDPTFKYLFANLANPPEKLPQRLLQTSSNLSELAKRTGISRVQLSKYKSAQARISVSTAWVLIDFCTGLLFDLLDGLIGISNLPSISHEYQRAFRARQLLVDDPIAGALIRVFETVGYHANRTHVPGYAAHRLGISLELESQLIEKLFNAGLIELNPKGRYRVLAKLVDLHNIPHDDAKRLKSFWLNLAANRFERFDPTSPDTEFQSFGYLALSVSKELIPTIRAELRECHLKIRKRLMESAEPADTVLLVYTGISELG